MAAPKASRRTGEVKPRLQCGALAYRGHETLEVLLVTSRGRGRWVIPKGWPMRGRSRHAAAAIEALEEAGVVGEIGRTPLGDYDAVKIMSDGEAVPCRVEVYPLRFTGQKDRWREQGQRVVRWFASEDAAAAVSEPGLARIIRRFAKSRTSGAPGPP